MGQEGICERIRLFRFFSPIFVGVIFVLVYAVSRVPEIRYGNRPIESAQVEVVDKRIEVGSLGTVWTYFASFKFPDGSVKEFDLGCVRVRGFKEPVSAYAAIEIGDTGRLKYKEISNLEQRIPKESIRHAGRYFWSFKKDEAANSGPASRAMNTCHRQGNPP